ncbi:MAG: ATP-binding cassette domain-containing protein [Trebonia sp.]
MVVGGDGAGKSTSLEVLVGLLAADAGAVRRPPKQRIGYVPATAGVFTDLTVGENLDFTTRAYQVPGGDRARIAAHVTERTGLTPALHLLAGRLSGGMRRKLSVGMTLLHSPELLVIDEPTTGVDPVNAASAK